jgi:hypothetical protein
MMNVVRLNFVFDASKIQDSHFGAVVNAPVAIKLHLANRIARQNQELQSIELFQDQKQLIEVAQVAITEYQRV